MQDNRPASPFAFAGLQELCAIGSVVEVVIVALNGQPMATSVADIDVSATAPSGVQRECEVTRSKNAFIATFSPNETGEWQVSIRYDGRHIRSSPFPCHIFDAAAVIVRGLDVGLVGQELAFIVDATRAGQGNLAVHVSRDGKPLNCHVDERSAQLYHVHFTPDDASQYKIRVTFNEIDVKGSPFLLDIVDTSTTAAVSAYGDQLRLAAVGRLAAFFISAAPSDGTIVDSKDIAVIVTGPSKREKHARIIPLDLTTFKAEFKPIDAGEHQIDVLVHDVPIAESPFICNVGDPDLVTAKHMPEAIEAQNLHTVHSFEIDATAAGSGNLEIIINGGRIACRVWETAPRHFQAQFTPTQPVRHTVEMKFNGEHVLHSPWQLPFRGGSGAASPGRRASLRARSPLQQPLAGLSPIEHHSELIGQGLRRAAVGQVASFEIKSESLKIGNVIIRLFDTEGRELDVKIIEKSHALRCEYVIKQVGEYRLEVYINGQLIDSGPLFISGYDAGKIRVTPFGDFITGQPVNFIVDAVEAGKGQLEISVNQGRVPNNVQMQDAGRCLVTFIPQHSGTYVIDVTFNGQQVHGCPIKVDVHTKQVGKLVSAPVYSAQTGGASVGGTPSPAAADRGSSVATDREPSSAYFSASSPQVDTTYSSMSYGAGTPSPYGAALRSPLLVAATGHRQSSEVLPTTPPTTVSNEHLRSPRLVQSVGPTESSSQPSVGYTVAQYGAGEDRRLSGERRFAGTSRSENAQFEMTRSTELTLKNTPPTSARHSVQPPTQTSENVGTILKSGKTYKRFESIGGGDLSPRSSDQPTDGGDDHSTADALRERHVYDEIPAGGGLAISQKAHELAYTPLKLDEHSSDQQTMTEPGTHGDVDYTHVVEPHASNIDALTPSTQRKLLENSVADLKESDGGQPISPGLIMRQQSGRADEPPRSEPSSKHSSKPTTPRLGLKFGKSSGSGKEIGSPVGRVGFDFGKSKITSKNEVVRRGKDVEVKVESLKLGKDDQLKVVVMAPVRKGQQPVQQPAGEALSPPEVPHKLKKSRNTYEISFYPTEVGTHKVLLFVNNQFPHPQTPFPIRVYDAAEIIVGEIVGESAVNDTVEFTVDAGRAGFGNLEMAIKDSDQCIIPSHVSQLEAGTAKFLVTFNPTSLGVHTVNITFNKEVIKDSPFEVNVIEYVGGKYGGESSTLERKRRDKVKDKKDKKKDRSSSTKSGGSGTSTKRDRSTGGGDPATIGRSLVVSKIPSLSRVDRPAELIVTLPAASSRLEAHIYDCEKEVVPNKIIEDQENINARCIQFVPKRFGDHEIELRLDGEDVNGSPFTCRVYDPTRIVVSPIPDAIVDVPVHFTVDAAAAGVGNLEVAVNDGKIPSMAHALGQHKYDISFTPRELADHYVSVRFNNERVPGSPFLCRVVEAGAAGGGANFSVSGPGLERVPIQRPVEFWITVPDGETNESIEPPEVSIVDPHGEPIEAQVSRNPQDHTRFLVIYTPSSVGNHQVDVRWDGEPLAGAPFTSKAFDANAAQLILAEGGAEVGLPCTFTIDAAKAGAGNMEIIVSVGKRNVPNFVTAEGQAKFKVSFTPQEANDHQISVKFNGIPIPGSPMRCPVSGPGGRLRGVSLAPQTTPRPDNSVAAVERRLADELAVAAVGRVKRFAVDAPPSLTRNAECDVVVLDARRGPLPVRCYKQQDGSYAVEFTPEQIGTHKIEITFADVPLASSPFHCEVVDLARVTLRGVDEPLAARAVANIVVNRVNAGAGDLTLELRDSHGMPLKLNRVRGASGEDTFTFLPTKLGPHTLNASLAGYPLPGTPQTLIVEEPSRPCVYGAALDYACVVGQQASMIFDAKHVTGGLKIQVVPEAEDGRPDGAKLRHTTDKRLDGTTEIAFRPTRVGYYRVTVDFNNQPVSGSPIRVAVVDPERVALRGEALGDTRAGDGMLHMRAGVTSAIDVDASGAGPGTLRVEVRGAQQSTRVNAPDSFTDDVATRVYDLGFGQWRVEVTPRAGTPPQRRYKLYFYWAELVVPSAYPLAAIVDGETLEQQTPKPARSFKTTTEHTVQNGHDALAPIDVARQIFLDGDGAAVAALKLSTEFFVDASALRTSIDGDRLDALLAGERADVPVRITVADRPNVFLASYTPLMAGRYELSVRYGGEHVRGSPATVDVRGHMTAAELIKVDTKTLKIGIIGEDVKTVIDARQAKAGHLSAQCVGPSQVEYCELFDNRDSTYILRVTPKELGRHQLTIKYAGDHVPGSPFTFNVSNPPDAGQVRVYGPGIEHGILHSFKSNFVVETKGAGAGQLTVRVRGPKGAFNVEMQRDRQQDRTIHCKYEPREPGDYQVEIKWHGQHVPGSPFLVLIVDTEEELHRFLAGGAPSPPPTTPFAPPGWLPPPPGMIGRGPPLPHMLPAPPTHLLGGPPPQHMPQHYYPHHHPAALPHPIYGQRPSPRAHRY